MSDDTDINQGWAIPTATARKSHYFADGRSFCGKYGYWGNFEDSDPFKESPDDCLACRRRFIRTYGIRRQIT